MNDADHRGGAWIGSGLPAELVVPMGYLCPKTDRCGYDCLASSVNAFQSALVSALEGDGPSLLALATEPDLDAAMAPVMLDPVATKRRFMEAVGAPRYVSIFFGGGNLVEP